MSLYIFIFTSFSLILFVEHFTFTITPFIKNRRIIGFEPKQLKEFAKTSIGEYSQISVLEIKYFIQMIELLETICAQIHVVRKLLRVIYKLLS